MTTTVHIKFIRLAQVLTLTGTSKSKHYTDIKQGIPPPPISLGERAKGYLEHEIMAINLARAKGATNEALKAMVQKLVKQRNSIQY